MAKRDFNRSQPPWEPAPNPPVELICTLSTYADIIGHRLVCQKTMDGEPRHYHLAIPRRLVPHLNALFDERPFRRLRTQPHGRVALCFYGAADRDRSEIYVLLSCGRSRLKRRLQVPPFVLWELDWVAALKAHSEEYGRRVFEA